MAVHRAFGERRRTRRRSPGPECREGTRSSAARGMAPEHRHTGLFAGLAQHLPVARRADPVQDHPGQPGRGVEGRKAVQQTRRCCDFGHARVDHQQYDGAPEQAGDVRGGPTAPGRRRRWRSGRRTGPSQPLRRWRWSAPAVRCTGISAADQRLPHQHRVQVAAGPAGWPTWQPGSMKLGADLERRHLAPGAGRRRSITPCGLPRWSFRYSRRARR